MNTETRELVPVKVKRQERKVEQPIPLRELPSEWKPETLPKRWTNY